MKKDESGSAFPLVSMSGMCLDKGMTLHDYAALKILQGLMANPERYKYMAELVAEDALTNEQATAKNINKANLMADAWIAERNKP